MARALIYIRCSHVDSAESGLGLAAQEATCRAYFDFLRMSSPTFRELQLYPEVFRDVAVSAYQKSTRDFDKRKAGRRLVGEVLPGDQLIFAKLDRAFRNAMECRRWVDHWIEMGVGVHFVDLQLNLTSSAGKLILGILSYVAEWESLVRSERTKEGLKQKILRDGYIKAPLGSVEIRDEDGERELVDDHRRRLRIRYLAWMVWTVNRRRVEDGKRPFTHPQIAHLYDGCMAKREGRQPYKALSRCELQEHNIRRDLRAAQQIWPERYAIWRRR